jgi:hypothetical protein
MRVRTLSGPVVAVAAAVFVGAISRSAPHAQIRDSSIVEVTLSSTKLAFAPTTAPTGTVAFRIVNRTKVPRRFTIGGSTSTRIAVGKSATLRVAFKTGGFYSSVAVGRASRLAGLFHIVDPCTSPATTTVNVQMAQDQGGITLSQSQIPCGTVTFVVSNTGDLIDSLQVFADTPQSAGTTPELSPGQTARLTVRFTVKGIAYYQSGDYPPAEPEFGGDYGEGGQLSIT